VATDGKHICLKFPEAGQSSGSFFRFLRRVWGERSNFMRICAAMDDAEERIRVERNAAARKDEDLVRAGKEMRASAMNRRSLGGKRSSNKCAEPVDIDNVDDMESQFDGSPKNASNSSDLPSGLTIGRKRKRSTLDLQEIIAGAEGPRADQ
jgi:hypothetical protein